jgi:hypothetical protein
MSSDFCLSIVTISHWPNLFIFMNGVRAAVVATLVWDVRRIMLKTVRIISKRQAVISKTAFWKDLKNDTNSKRFFN